MAGHDHHDELDVAPVREPAGTGATGTDQSTARRAQASIVRRDRARADAAQAMAGRERLKARQAEERVRALEAELAALRGSIAYRLTFPLRRLAAAVPSSLYASLRGGPAAAASERGPAVATPIADPAWSATAERRPVALLLDDWFPQPDRDSGSIDIVNLACILRASAFGCCSAPIASMPVPRGATRSPHSASSRSASTMRRAWPRSSNAMAVCWHSSSSTGSIAAASTTKPSGRTLRSHAWSSTPSIYIGSAWNARRGSVATPLFSKQRGRARTRELQLARDSDATIVVSSTEHDLLSEAAPDATVLELPLARPTRPSSVPFAARSGIGFIGGFRHAPNLDALRWFTSEIWPLVRAALPDCRFSVVGPDLPPGMLDDVPGRVEALGHLPDIGPWFESLRVTAAPLRFGAGAKGKVVSSLAAGVPCVGTTLALEGMGITPEMGVADLADDPAGFARALITIHEDPSRWERMSMADIAHVGEHFSITTWRDRIAELLWLLDVHPDRSESD